MLSKGSGQLVDVAHNVDGLSKKDVKGVLEALTTVGHKELKKSGAFLVPGFAKFVVIKKPATLPMAFSVGAPSAAPSGKSNAQTDRTLQVAIWLARIVIYAGLFFGVGGAFYAAWIATGPLPTQGVASAARRFERMRRRRPMRSRAHLRDRRQLQNSRGA